MNIQERLIRDMLNKELNLIDGQYTIISLDTTSSTIGSVSVKIKYSTEDEQGFVFSQFMIAAFINDKINASVKPE